MTRAQIGIIGGSGLYSMPGLRQGKEVRVKTPFGAPSDAYVCGTLEGRKVAFLARHGRGHRLLPTELNFRANIHGFKQLGVERIVSVSAVGSLKEEHKPLEFVIPDQFFDRTRHRVDTFFGGGVVAHIAFADPVCGELAKVVDTAARTAAQARVTKQGLRRGSKRFGEAMWAPFVRLSGVLWLEITGVFFGIFALFALGAMWKLRGEWHATATNVEGHRSLLGAVAMLVVFGYFCVSSFVRARRRERGR